VSQPSDLAKKSASRWVAVRRFLGFVGPGFLVAVGYMDPGNWATDLAGGSEFGYALLWVILLANLMAILFQHLCVRLQVATGQDLAQACRARYSPAVSRLLWLSAQIGIIAMDLAELLGSAI
jgi:manganese transport protein